MNALTLSAPRRRDQVVILSALNIGAQSSTLCSSLTATAQRTWRRVCRAVTPSAVCTAAATAAGIAAVVAGIVGYDLTASSAALASTVGIFIVSPALDARKAKKGGVA